ncbi:MAG: SEC59/DGK1/VTE5 family protein [Bacteroidota bacterium]|nr:SEC59/DGK1/VTE5 family protein [Bacteroidota bacterium]
MESVSASPELDTVRFKGELVRKAIHLCSLSIPVIYFYVSRSTAIMVLVPLTAAFLAGDLLRLFHKPSYVLYRNIFGPILRPHESVNERRALNGATWILMSALFCVIVFPKLITVTAFAVLIISDSTAALVGKRFGTRVIRGKTFEGSLAFVISACLVVLFTPKIVYHPAEYVIGMIAAAMGALAEIFSFDIVDDNFAIPVGIGFTLWALYAVFFPGLNVYFLDR